MNVKETIMMLFLDNILLQCEYAGCPSIEKRETQRKIGFLKGKLQMSDDFDASLEDFKDYM